MRAVVTFLIISIVAASSAVTVSAQTTEFKGIVRDTTGSPLPGASVQVMSSTTLIGSAITGREGDFTVRHIAPGDYVVVISLPGFREHRGVLRVPASANEPVSFTLDPAGITEEVTVTADLGRATTTQLVVQPVNVVGRDEIRERAQTVVAQIAQEEAGLQLQRTSPTIGAIFVRGLSGAKVNVFVDGVRYSTSAMRGGINTFFNLNDPSTLDGIEVLRGPNSAQYGSDALGGSVQLLSQVPVLTPGPAKLSGQLNGSVATADVGFASSATVTYAGQRAGVLMNVAARHAGDVRPGGGIDSHAAVTRFFGLPSSQFFGERLPETAFRQYGGSMRGHWVLAPGSSITARYVREQQPDGKRYDQLLGGDGNLIADLKDVTVDLAYARYERQHLGPIDRAAFTYSFNRQREERINQGGNGNPRAAINHEPETIRVHGVQALFSSMAGKAQVVTFGGDFYGERIDAPSFAIDPVTHASTLRRGRIPDNARYRLGGAYIQDSIDLAGNRLRIVGNLRFSGASYEARAADSPLVNGRALWRDDEMQSRDVTFRAGAVAAVAARVRVSASVSRGFRAPHMADVGTLGLTGAGYEAAAVDLTGRGATLGSTANASAVSTGLAVEPIEAERNTNFDVGLHVNAAAVQMNVAVFVNQLRGNIEKWALILPPGAVGTTLGSEVITAQSGSGVVFVALSTNPVLVRANRDNSRIYGLEHTLDWRPARGWSLGTTYTYIHAADQASGLPPNIEGGTPAPGGYIKLRYGPPGARYWIEPFVHAAARQSRLSTLDLDDRRTGASRSRASIRAFFLNGATARGYVSAGADGVLGSSDDQLIATGETLARIQDRVLGAANASVLSTAVPGFVTLNLRGGVRIDRRHDIVVALENIADRNYRGISWGVDAPGRNLFVSYRLRF